MHERVDQSQLARTLDLWASMWEPRERLVFERALERVLVCGRPELESAALAACYAIATPRLLGAAEQAVAAGRSTASDAEAVRLEMEPVARLLAHAARLARDRDAVEFLLAKTLRDPHNPVADKLLDRVDVRDLWAVMHASDDDDLRGEAARRIARRGPHQRTRLCSSLDLPDLDQELAMDVPLDDLAERPFDFNVDFDFDAHFDAGSADDSEYDIELELEMESDYEVPLPNLTL